MKTKRYKRWIGIGCNDPWIRTLKKARKLGMSIINGGKPGFVAWYGLCLLGTPERMQALQAWWDETNIDWYDRQPRGAWPVETTGEAILWATVMKNVREPAA